MLPCTSAQHLKMTVFAAVIGAGGPTGRLCVEQLLAAEKSVRAVVRSPDKYIDTFPSSGLLEIVRGDATNLSSINSAVDGADGIIYAASGSSYFGAHAVECEVGLCKLRLLPNRLRVIAQYN